VGILIQRLDVHRPGFAVQEPADGIPLRTVGGPGLVIPVSTVQRVLKDAINIWSKSGVSLFAPAEYNVTAGKPPVAPGREPFSAMP
jgi:hypothetical protein